MTEHGRAVSQVAAGRRPHSSLDGYLDARRITEHLHQAAARRPEWVRAATLGDDGYELPYVTVSPTGTAGLPELLVVANLHPAEVLGSTLALRLVDRLAERAAAGDLSARVHIFPRIAMRGTDRFLAHGELPRGDGTTAGPPVHLDVRYPHAAGRWCAISPDSVFMRPAEPGERTRRWAVVSEATLASVTEPSWTDLNRNFPTDWDPALYGGPSPLSEPAAAALAGFVRHHPAIVAAVDLHTYAGCALLPPSMPEWGRTALRALVRNTFDVPTVVASAESGFPPEGTLVQWLAQEHGVLALALELYGPHHYAGVLSRSKVWQAHTALTTAQAETYLRWLRELRPEAVVDWHDIPETTGLPPGAQRGGVDRRFTVINPPAGSWLVEDQAARFHDFFDGLFALMPRPSVRLRPAAGDGELELSVENHGGLGFELLTRDGRPCTIEVRSGAATNALTVPALPGWAAARTPQWLNVTGSVFTGPGVGRHRWVIKAPGGAVTEATFLSPRTGAMTRVDDHPARPTNGMAGT